MESGHEEENFLKEFPVLKLYRYGPDVTNNNIWKIRAITVLMYYFDPVASVDSACTGHH